jgi:hypothetical protein
MLKYIEAGSWDGFNCPIATEVPVSSRGFMHADRLRFLSKTAATEQFVHDIGNIKTAGGDILVHVNAIGSTEFYNCNRKGDGFRESVLKEWHPTFVKRASVYTHHKNRDPEINFGKVASSCYNDNMHRVELLLQCNGNSDAAQRNNGLVLPTEFLDKLEKDAELAVSMGTWPKMDVCSICGNESKSRNDYCDETNCRDPKTGEYWPGCKHGLMKVGSDGRVQYVDNIDPLFFDISFVGIPADRCGFGFRADYLGRNEKTAAVDLPSDQLIYYPTRGVPKLGSAYALRSEIYRLAQKEYVLYEKPNPMLSSEAFGMRGFEQDIALGRKVASMLPETRYDGLRYLAEHGVFLSPANFITAFGLPKEAEDTIRTNSDTVYRELNQRCKNSIGKNLASVMASFDNAVLSKTAEWLMPEDWLRKRTATQESVAQNVVKGIYNEPLFGKTASGFADQWSEAADAYALYKAAALCFFPKLQKEFGERFAVGHTFSKSHFVS